MSLRLKLLLAASLLLAVPVAGYRFVLAMEAFLRTSQLQSVASTAQALASALEAQPDSIIPATTATSSPARDLYVHPLAAAPQVDGYASDWAELTPDPTANRPQARAGSHGESLYFILRWPSEGNDSVPVTGVRFILEDAPQLRRAWLIDVSIPGRVPVLEVPPGAGATGPAHRDTRFVGAVGRDAGTLVVELRLPASLRAPLIYFERVSLDPEFLLRIPATGALQLLMPPPALQRSLDVFGTVPGRRLRVTDLQGRVLAQSGSLGSGAAPGRLQILMEGLLDADKDALLSLAPDTLTLEGSQIVSALAGVPRASLRRDTSDGAMVAAAAHPLKSPKGITGALVLEESTSGIAALARRALLELLAGAGLAFVAATALLLLVAGRSAARLRELRDQARLSIDGDGRVQNNFEAPSGGDEIGDLGRSFEAAVSRLKGYQDYLEQLARRLSHELRTPIAVIRSSLDNMALDPAAGDHAAPSIERARHGVERLDALIRRMSEATRLEHAMTDTQRTSLDLAELVKSAVEAQAEQWPTATLKAVCDRDPVPFSGSQDLLLQALDKLMANAKGFAVAGSTVTVRIREVHGTDVGGALDLCVENEGPALPDGPTQRLFDSMVSERPGPDDGEPHLGLGLYIVRLVARFHGGQELAENLTLEADGVNGVRIGMRLPWKAKPR